MSRSQPPVAIVSPGTVAPSPRRGRSLSQRQSGTLGGALSRPLTPQPGVEIVSLALQAQAELAFLPAWAPGETLVSLLRSSAGDLGAGANTFIDRLDAFDTDQMRRGALRMDSGGSELSSAQSEVDRLSTQYGRSGC